MLPLLKFLFVPIVTAFFACELCLQFLAVITANQCS